MSLAVGDAQKAKEPWIVPAMKHLWMVVSEKFDTKCHATRQFVATIPSP